MSDLLKQLADLSPEKQQLLLLRLKQQREKAEREKVAYQQIVPKSRDGSLPVSFAQQRLWFLHQLEPDSAAYHIPGAVRMQGDLDIPILEQSVREIIHRHEVLRTNLIAQDSKPVQTIHADYAWNLVVVDLQHLPATEQEREMQLWATEQATKPFDLANDCLLRVTLLVFSESDFVLLFCMHHIVSDGWSMGIFVQELASLYNALRAGLPSPLPALSIQYADFAAWQRQWLQGEVLQAQLDYWQKQLADAPALLEMPTDRPRPAVQSWRGATQSFILTNELTEALNALSRSESVTPFMTLLTAFDILLYRYTGQTDILVGSPLANRNRREIENLIGFFVNTVIFRSNLAGDPCFRELLAQVRQVSLGAIAHQDLPFELLIELLHLERDLSYNPLFQVMFVLQNAPISELELPDLKLSPLGVETQTAKFDLTLSMDTKDRGLVGIWEYSTDLFDADTIARMTAHFQTLLESIVAQPEQSISQLSLLSSAEQQQLLLEWNNSASYGSDRCLHELFEQQVERTPDAVAVLFAEQQLTYLELNDRANQLAHYLQALGVQPDSLVGISLERSLEMVVGILGILKAGGAYVPLDPDYPHERLSFMLSDSQVKVLLTQQRLVDGLPAHKAQVVCLDTDWEAIALLSRENGAARTTPDRLAYVIYTSGSTGQPKGVLIRHKAIVAHCLVVQSYYEIQASDRVLQFASLNFDPSVEQIFPALLQGGSIVLRDAEIWNPQELLHKILDLGITVVNLPTTYWQQVAQEWSDRTDLFTEAFPNIPLRLVIVGGEAMVAEYLQPWWKIWRKIEIASPRLLNAYGPTEATITALAFEIPTSFNGKRIPIGRPLGNRTIYILDAHLQPVPIGVSGELHIGGDCLASGYLNRPELTMQKFIPNPFNTEQQESQARLYKTGDLARYLPDGNIEYLGRIDDQVKIRGFRIELGEIEMALSEHPAVSQVAAIAREDVPGEKRLVAYLVLKPAQSATVSELRQFLKEKLPEYSIPSVFAFIESFPLMPNGKVDRHALPAPEFRPDLEAGFIPPRNAIEQTLAQIWAEVLGIERVGVYDNFFELGGDSILSLQIIARANQAGLQLTPKQLFANPKIAQLASVAGTTRKIQAEQGLVTGDVPLTPIQHWFFEKEQPEPYHFNQSVLLSVPPDLNPELLEPVMQHLVRHHDALRLRFDRTDSSWEQRNADGSDIVTLQVVDLSTKSSEAQLADIEAIGGELQASLHLSDGPLIRAALFQLGSDRPGRLLLTIHHLAVDGVSWRILLEDLLTAYQQSERGETIHLPSKTTSFRYWAQRLKEYAQTEALAAEFTYWRDRATQQLPLLPRDNPSNSTGINTVASTATIAVSLDKAETLALLHDVPKAYNTQINDILLAALMLAIHEWTGDRALRLNLEGHGREDLFDEVDLSRTVGWFTTLFPVVLNLGDSTSPQDVLKRIKEQLRGIPNKGMGYGLLRYLSGGDRASNGLQTAPAAEICFNYLGQFDRSFDNDSGFEPAAESAGAQQSWNGQRSHLLEINSTIAGGQLHLNWTYSENIHHATTIENLAQAFVRQLRSLIAHCISPEAGGSTPSDFPLATISQLELDRLGDRLTTWKNLEDLYPLSPMQQGILFHSLYAPDSGVYVEMLCCTMRGRIDIQAFEQAWQQVVDRHAIFRTAFVWQDLDLPLQAVFRQVQLPVVGLDWQNLSPEQQHQQLQQFLESAQKQGFDLGQAPLMHLYLIQLDREIYQFVWSHHHILLDGWSMPLVLKEVFDRYEAIGQGQILTGQWQPAIAYRDYIAWLQQQDMDKARTYWQQKLQGFTAPTAIGANRSSPRDRQQSSSYSEQAIALSIETTNALRSFARQHQLTLNNLMQGAWSLLLSRYSGESDVVFGATVSGRPPALPGVESLVGLLINTLPMRVQVANDTELLPWLKALQTQQVESEQYAYTPLVEIQSWSDVTRGMSLFESILVFENYPVDTSLQQHEGSLEISNVRGVEQTNYPLTAIAAVGEQLMVKLSYDNHRYDRATIALMLQHLQTLLTGMVAHPDLPVTQLPMLTAAEQQQLREWNLTEANYPNKCIHQLFEEQAERTPDAIAIVQPEIASLNGYDEQLTQLSQLSYEALNSRANQLAHYLQKLGVAPDTLVAINLPRSLDLAIAILGTLKAGGAYVPLDPAYPSERLAFMLADTQAPIVLTHTSLLDSLPEHQARIICLDKDWSEIAEYPDINPASQVSLDRLTYVIYTSGSTGKPKGVMLGHRALTNLICWQLENSTLSAGARTLQFAALSFDVSFQEFFSTWCAGGTLVLVSEELRRDSTNLLHFMDREKVERVFLPFIALQHLAEAADTYGILPTSLREVITAGEQLQVNRYIVNLFAQLECCTLENQYGPSESHVVTAFRLKGSPAEWTALPPIGGAIANSQIYLLDDRLQPVPIGIAGELYIGGICLAQGYLNRPELTAERFIPNPFSNEPHSRLYKTGDIARYLPDGAIEYVGRIDNQVKVRGFRIELGEIEAALTNHPTIKQTAAIVREDVPGDKRLVAYLVCDRENPPAIADLRQFLKQKLPEYMLPSAFVFLEALPLTPSGKIDRRALPTPDGNRQLETAFVAPTTPTELSLAQIWTDVLGITQIGIRDNFFDLGGHSLLATQLISRVRTAFRLEVPLRSLFEAPTIAEFAEYILVTKQDVTCAALPLVAIAPDKRDKPLPLSFAQQRLWFLQQLDPESAAYHIPGAIRLHGQLNVSALERCFQEIVLRHEALRTNFIIQDGQALQIIRNDAAWNLSIVDLQHLPDSEQEAEAQRIAIERSQRPFNLSQDCLLQVTLLVLSETDSILLFCMHHIVSDGWSMGIFVQEFATLYTAFCQELPSPLPDLAIQYADFAVWQRQWLQGDILQTQLAYWQNQLADAPALLELPADRPRPAVQGWQGATHSSTLPLELTTALNSLSQRESVTPFMTLLAAFDILLYRYTGRVDILVGSPIANRNRSEIEGLIGSFINTLVFRSNLAGNPSFRELLARVREVSLEAFAHQDLPFELLIETLKLERDLSYSPLFQVMFILQNAPTSDLELPGLSLSAFKTDSQVSTFDLTLSIEQTDEGMVGSWEYSTDLFDTDTISRMTAHFQTLLEGIVAHPDMAIAQLPILNSTQQHQLLVDWNNTQADYPQELCIHQLFEQQVERTPDAVAIVFEDRHLTYQELNSQANQLAHYLRSLGVSSEVLVGICVERSLEMVVGLLAILKAGGAYVPLDPNYPPDRLDFMLSDAKISVLLTQQQLGDRFPEINVPIVCIDTDSENIARHSQGNPSSAATPENLAYVIYTSGSTGKPKGVAIAHRSLLNFSQAAIEEYGLKAGDRILQFASISFDVAAEEIYPALSCGATVVLRTEAMLNSIATFLDCCQSWNLTVLDLPTAYWHQLTTTLATEQLQLPTSIRLAIVGGERVLPTQLQLWHRTVGKFPQLIDAYGPTEATVETTLCDLSALSPSDYAREVPIGRPLQNVSVYVLDDHLQPVPIGVHGELHIGGAGLARGYLNRPELTQEKFIPNPFSTDPQARLYKTGDLVRYLPNGAIAYVGRIDNQVKIRGYRIELGEIEAALSRNPNVSEVAIIAREDVPGDKRLVAYLVCDREQPPAIADLRQFLKQKLPEYMLPSAFVFLDALPLTPSGKIDRRALPTPDGNRQLETAFVAPTTPTELSLAQIWTDVLGITQIGIRDNFFDLGGHSLLATQLISRVRTAFRLEVPLRSLFEAPTIAEFAEYILVTKQDVTCAALPLVAIAPDKRDKPLPLSFAQQRLWFLQQLDPESAAYHIPGAIRLHGQLNVSALERCFQEIVRRHEALRTNFIIQDGQPLQIIRNDATWNLYVVDLQHLSDSEQESEARRIAIERSQQPFNLSQDCLLQVTLLVLSETDSILLFCMHHIVSDGWSMGIFVQEFAALYTAFCQEQPSPLPELSIQYADFAVWQRQWLQGDVLQSQLTYWQNQLAYAPALLELPADRPRPAVQGWQGATQTFILPIELSEALNSLSRRESVTPFMTLLAAFDILLYRYTNQTDILVGSPIANRNRSEIEGLIGFFVNTLVFRSNLSGNPSFLELLARVREVSLGAYAHQDLPFELLVETLQLQRDLSYSPLFQVMFILQNAPVADLELPDLSLTPFHSESLTSTFDLTLSMEQTDQGLVGSWEYSTDLFDAATIARMTAHFQTLLEGIVTHPEMAIAQFPLMTTTEQQQLLVDWNNTQLDYPHNQCIHELFEQQVERSPDAIALVFEEQQLTYQELNQRANRLAHYLKDRGVGAEILVGICLERSLDLVVAVLAVLKAGGAYIPLDPNYPPDRLEFMLRDSQLSLLLTSENLMPQLGELGELSDRQIQLICLDMQWSDITTQSSSNPDNALQAEQLAYTIYTSGSTGTPKGVMVTHRSLVNAYWAWECAYKLRSRTHSHLQMANFSFDVFAGDLVRALCSGGKLVLCPREFLLSPAQLYQLMRDREVDCAEFVPAVIRNLIEYLEKTAQNLDFMQILVVGSDSWYVQEYLAFQRFCGPQTRLINSYGVSEATIDSSYFEIGAVNLPAEALVPIGKPIGNTQLYVLDANMQPVPVGVPGELHIGGKGLARGYCNRPELTQQRFIANPFISDPHARLYKTGDLVRFLPDGNLELLGRIDNQVKLRGFRIELGEIEAVLSQHPSVAQTAAIVWEDVSGDKRLVAYLVVTESEVSVNALRQFLKERLPEYMVPAAFVFLDALPLNPNGKVDRRALPAPDANSLTGDTNFAPPRDVVEQQLVEIWSEVLNLYPVGVNGNFFNLGGHSLLAVQLMSKIEQQFGIVLPLAALFQNPTIEQLAVTLRQPIDEQQWSSLIPIKSSGSKSPFFCVPGAGGNPLYLYNLAHHLDRDRPFYALQSVGLDGKSEPHSCIEDMAADYIQSIQSLQPQGPYLLGGHSFGGQVAFEMALQLQKMGQEVSLLAFLDSGAPEEPDTNQIANDIEEADWWYEIGMVVEGLYGTSLELDRETLTSLTPDQQLIYFQERLKASNLLAPDVGIDQLRGLIQVYKNQVQMIYQPKEIYHNQITFFMSSKDEAMDESAEESESSGNPALGWHKFCSQPLDIHIIPGSHFTMMNEPHVQVLAECLATCITQVEEFG
jgi:amino acid adenylation domain-containing protein/non-ribosomal peptide synthase protein (TIGR01720 family)